MTGVGKKNCKLALRANRNAIFEELLQVAVDAIVEERARAAATAEAIEAMSADEWERVISYLAMDRYGNITVPGLATIASMRKLSRSLRDAAKLVSTPYDGIIQYTTKRESGHTPSTPAYYKGGMLFTHVDVNELPGPGVVYVRDRFNSQMFAVTKKNWGEHRTRRDFVDDDNVRQILNMNEVDSWYPLAQIARLVSGHSASRVSRLQNIESLMYRGHPTRGPLIPEKEVHTVSMLNEERRNAVIKPPPGDCQLRSYRHVHVGTPNEVRRDDFLNFRVQSSVVNVVNHQGQHRLKRVYTATNDLVLVTKTEDKWYEQASFFHQAYASSGFVKIRLSATTAIVDKQRFYFKGVQFINNSFVHCLSIANGWFASPAVAEGPKWMTSIFKHNMSRPYPKENREMSFQVLDELMEHAKTNEAKRVRALAQVNALTLKNQSLRTTMKRPAAVRANAALKVHPLGIINIIGRLSHEYQPEDEKQAELDGLGEVDDSYQGPNDEESRTIMYDSEEDEEYLPRKKTEDTSEETLEETPAARKVRKGRKAHKARKARKAHKAQSPGDALDDLCK